MKDDNKHNYYKCPYCGVDVIKTDSICWSCNKDLAEIHNKIQEKKRLKQLEAQKRLNKKLKIITPKRILSAFGILILLYLIINLFTFGIMYSQVSSSGINLKAKAYMTAANGVNYYYVIPLFQVCKIDFPLKDAVQAVRDYLFDKGAEYIPKDDGETYVWWFIIKYWQFEKSIKSNINDYAFDDRYNRSEKEIQNYLDWTNQFYNVIEKLSKLKIKDKYFRERRLNSANALALAYSENRYLILRQYYDKQTGDSDNFFRNNAEIEKFKKLFHIYNRLFDYCKTKERESYDYFFDKTERHMYHYIANKEITDTIIKSMLFKKEKFNCDYIYLNTYGDSLETLLNVYDGNLTRRVDADNLMWTLSFGPTERNIVKLCPNNKHLSTFRNYIEKEDNWGPNKKNSK